jgi:HlyD family secretion protein/epimerase transport system membrane fusion protein
MQKPGSNLESRSRSWQPLAQQPSVGRRARLSPMLLGLTAIVVAVGGLAAWSATAPISSAVIASGKVAVASKRKEIQHLDGGIVKAIHVRDGDVVKEGDVVLELDDTKAKARHVLARAAYFSAVIAQARLAAERDGADEIAFPAELLAEAKRSPEIAQGIENQKQVFDSRGRELAGQIKIWLQRIAQLKDEINGLTAERTAAVEQSNLAGKESVIVEDMFERGFVTRQRVHSIRRERAQLAGSIGRLDASIAKARKEIGETELSIQQLTLRRQSEVLTELKDIEQRIFDLKGAYLVAGDELTRLAVTAPVGGFIVNSQAHTIGGVIRPGQTVLEIVPGADALIVEARVRPLDIDEVARGQTTEVRFSGFKQRTTPFILGTVTQVSADAVADVRTGELYYSAIVSISYSELARLGHRLQPGMPAELLIKTGLRTPIAYLAQPLLDSMHKALREQ